MDNNNIMDTNNNIMDNTNIKSIKKKHSFKKKKKARPILSQHGGAKYDFDNLIGVKTKGNMSCWLDSGIQMLWNIDCLRDYLLTTRAEDIKNLKEMTQEEKNEENKEEKKIIETAVKKIVSNFDATILDTAISRMTRIKDPSELLENINIDLKTKLNMILALQSIFQTYIKKIDDINTKANADAEFINNNKQLFMLASNDRTKRERISQLELVAIMDDDLKYRDMDNNLVNSVDTLRTYMKNISPGDGDSIDTKRDPTQFIKSIFFLFESINDTTNIKKILKIKKCCKFYLVSRDITSNNLTLTYDIIYTFINKTNNTNLQDWINQQYIKDNTSLILLPETEILLFQIGRSINHDTHHGVNSISGNNSIKLSNRNFRLRGVIVHKQEPAKPKAAGDKTPLVRPAGHEAFIAYDDTGKKAALLNGTSKTNLIDIEEAVEHTDNVDYNPDTNGVLYLYQISDEVVEAAKVDPTELAEGLAPAIAAVGPAIAAVGADTSQPDTNVAAALTATLAATQVGPDAIEEANIPAALVGTVAAAAPASVQPTQLPASVMLTTAKPAGRGTSDIGSDIGRGRGTSDIGRGRGRGRGRGDGSSGNGSDDSANRGSGLHLQKRTQPPVEEKVEEKPYSGSLEPSSDSNGENMVLGILLVITLAISGVLFVQR
jgi:hypothetical protein